VYILKLLDYALFIATLVLIVFLLYATLSGDVDTWVLITRLGDEEFYLIASVVAYYLIGGWVSGFIVVSSIVLSGSLNVFLKYWLGLPRPPDPLVYIEGPGFPSGHAQVSSTFWLSLWLVNKRLSLALLSTFVVLGVSLSRVVLRAHFIHDVVGGVALGSLVALASNSLARLRGRRLLLGAISLHLVSTTLSLASMVLFKARLGAISALLGLSAALAITGALGAKPYTMSGVKWCLRLGGLIVSIALLLLVHTFTKGFVEGRIVSFAVAGFIVFSAIPAILRRLEEGAKRGFMLARSGP
jgi:membrane-associated phospholipid phosphatase